MKNRAIRILEFSNIIHYILLMVFMCVPLTINAGLLLAMSSAKETAALQNHYIVAFDLSVGVFGTDCNSNGTLELLESHLKKKGYNADKDYISILGYNLDLEEPDADSIVRFFRDSSNNPILWRKLGKKTLSSLFPNWPNGKPQNNPYSTYASMQSLAKPYTVMGTKNNEGITADRTFLVLVTDDDVNGADDDYFNEWKRIVELVGVNRKELERIRETVFSKAKSFNELFSFAQDDYKTLVAVDHYGKKKYNITQYEVNPNQLPSINSVSDFPSLLPLKKVKGGFRLNINVSSINKYYKIRDIQIKNGRDLLLCEANSGKFNDTISSQDIKVGDTLKVSMELYFEDGMYNGMRISSRNERFRQGLTVEQVVTIPDEAKIMGIMPLTDSLWWWSSDDVFSAVLIWDLIILLILIFVVIYIFYRCFVKINTYNPSNDKIKINKIE